MERNYVVALVQPLLRLVLALRDPKFVVHFGNYGRGTRDGEALAIDPLKAATTLEEFWKATMFIPCCSHQSVVTNPWSQWREAHKPDHAALTNSQLANHYSLLMLQPHWELIFWQASSFSIFWPC